MKYEGWPDEGELVVDLIVGVRVEHGLDSARRGLEESDPFLFCDPGVLHG